LSTIRRVNGDKYRYDDPRRYITAKDCLSEPEVLEVYCEKNPKTVCVGGYGFYGCCPEDKKREDFIKYDLQSHARYVRSDGKIIRSNETYCGRNIPARIWKGRKYWENQIWSKARLGRPDLVDGGIFIEAKGGLPSISKIHNALGQLLFYKENDPNFRLGFLFPKIWMEAENMRSAFDVLKKYKIELLPV
jgi:hypothetical protein